MFLSSPKLHDSPVYMREDPEWPNVVLAMHMDADPYWNNVVLAMPMDGDVTKAFNASRGRYGI